MALQLRADPSERATLMRVAPDRPGARSIRVITVGDEPEILARLRSLMGPDVELTPALSRDDRHARVADLVVVASAVEVPWRRVRTVATSETDLPVLVVAARWSDEDEQRALESGAIGYLALDLAPVALARAIRAALNGEIVFRRRALGRLLKPALKHRRTSRLGSLTLRQQQVASLLTTGAADKEIAAQLGIGVATVQKHVSKVLRTLGATNRAAAVWVILGGAEISRRV
jgi:DNA-binding NarL/FixJ family response regulator